MGIIATNQHIPLIEAIRELAEYRKQDPTVTAFNVGNSFYLVNEVWRRDDPKTAEEIKAHYRTCEMQVEQQVFATYGIPGEIALRDRITRLADPQGPLGMDRCKTVLDFGAGIGSQILPMLSWSCECTHADVGGVMMEYAAWRYRSRGYPANVGEPAVPAGVELVELKDDYLDNNPLVGHTFDLVICTEVIEHVTDPIALVKMLTDLVEPGGHLVATTSFDDGDGMVPMHLNVGVFTDEQFERQVFPDHGFERVEDALYRKVA